MIEYVEGLSKTDYVPNVVIQFAGEFFSIRQPDSGLVIDSKYNGLISRIAINPTSIDPLRATTTVNTNSFTLIDLSKEVSKLFTAQAGFRTGSSVRAWLGRSFENMDFSEYLELPETFLNKVQKVEAAYNFSTIEKKDRLNRGIFNIQSKLAVNILSNTTVITLQSIPASLPSAGFGKIGSEFISWASITGNNLEGCARGEFGSTPQEHEAGEDFFNTYDIALTNGIDFLAQILISGGGGGPYDVLPEGLGFDQSLVDLDQFETFRDEFFTSSNLSFRLWGIQSVQSFIEQEIYLPLGVRLRTNNNGKIGLALINRNIFEIDAPVINEDNTTKPPGFSVSDDKVVNQVRIFWDWSDGRNLFQETYEQVDTDSINEYDERAFTEFRFKGVKSLPFVQSFADLFLARFSVPRPEITVETLNSTSFLLVGDKTELVSSKIPTEAGDTDFISTLEVTKKSYNPTTGIVSYQLSFTSFSGLRQCIIAPSDTIISFSSQKIVTVAAGRGAHYRAGWVMGLFDNNTRDYASSQLNVIESISGDVITFADNWSTTLTNFNFKLKFADFCDVSEQQKKFCFVSENNNAPFSDDSKPYQITFN